MIASPQRPAPIADDGTHRGLVVDRVNGYSVVACETCGFRHVLPLPSAREQHAAYEEAYYRDEKPAYLSRARDDADWARLGNVRRKLYGALAKAGIGRKAIVVARTARA